MQNVLTRATFGTPYEAFPFDAIRPADLLPALREAMTAARAQVADIRNDPAPATFDNTVAALERSGERLHLLSAVLFNLHAAETNEEIQQATREASPLLTDYGNDILLDERIFARVEHVWNTADRTAMTAEACTLLDKEYRQFVRNGAHLDPDGKQRLRALDQQLADLQLTFGEHVLHATNSYALIIDDASELDGLPEEVVAAAAAAARQQEHDGKWLFTLHAPSYVPFMTYARHRGRREELYRAYGSRATTGDNDNHAVIRQLVQLRLERARLLGYDAHADFVLEERMAESPAKVRAFLDELLRYAHPVGEREVAALAGYAARHGGPAALARWDHAFWAEKLKMEEYEIDDELLKPFFSLENVVDGAFQVAGRLFDLRFRQVDDVPVYHPDVRTYAVEDGAGAHVGLLYTDFFPRAGKRSGAWMTAYRGQKRHDGHEQRPVISIVCNFTPPTDSHPSLLTFNEVTTLFHEFGHALHGLLADGTFESISGTNVYWDFVELPSQVMENWVYEKEALDLFARHHQSQEPISAQLVERLRRSARFMQGYQTLRQLGFAYLDLAYHGSHPEVDDVSAFEKQVLAATELYPPVPGTSASCAFSHIFQGSYAAGYYSYKWAEVLDADAFALFQQRGIFHRETADLFRRHVLAAGGSEHPRLLYRRFRGQEPSPQALLRRAGLLAE